MEAFTGLVALVLFLVVFGFVVGGIGFWILGPMHRATCDSKRLAQFFISDFLWLVTQLQVALAATLALRIQHAPGIRILLVAASWAAVVAIWWASVTALSRAGVRSPLRRASFTLIVVPMGTLGAVGLFFSNMAIFMVFVAGVLDGEPDASLPWLLLLNFPAAAVFFGCRRLMFWVLAGGDILSDATESAPGQAGDEVVSATVERDLTERNGHE